MARDMPTSSTAGKRNGAAHRVADAGRIVVVFQGGGALGAYQAGVYQALHEHGIEPDWIIGTSIGAINASLIAGNAPQDRLPALEAFWQRVSKQELPFGADASVWQSLSFMHTVSCGIPSFFSPNPWAHLGGHINLGAENAGYYSTAPLKRTLEDLVDFERINRGAPRLTIGAALVRTSQMRYFDSRDAALDVRHIMASGALPPAFPAVRIDGELYWDGGILSNTPAEAIFDDYPRFDSLVFAVHLWNPVGREPVSMWDVAHRQKDVQYSSRVANHIARQSQTHRLRHVIEELSDLLSPEMLARPRVQELVAHGCPTRMHILRLMAPSLDHDDQTKDVDFSASGIQRRWSAGYAHARRAIECAPWRGEFDSLDGVVLHEVGEGWQVKAGDPVAPVAPAKPRRSAAPRARVPQ
jgi:NTE family protein